MNIIVNCCKTMSALHTGCQFLWPKLTDIDQVVWNVCRLMCNWVLACVVISDKLFQSSDDMALWNVVLSRWQERKRGGEANLGYPVSPLGLEFYSAWLYNSPLNEKDLVVHKITNINHDIHYMDHSNHWINQLQKLSCRVYRWGCMYIRSTHYSNSIHSRPSYVIQ